jgi:hypothetical protein
MKALSLIMSLLLATLVSTAQARNSRVANATSKFCPGPRYVEPTDTIFCRSENSQLVKEARVGGAISSEDLRKLKVTLVPAVEAGFVPDADSDTVYFFTRWLVNAQGGKVGIITFEGWVNSEMGQSARFDIRYNLKGQVVSASEKPLK